MIFLINIIYLCYGTTSTILHSVHSLIQRPQNIILLWLNQKTIATKDGSFMLMQYSHALYGNRIVTADQTFSETLCIVLCSYACTIESQHHDYHIKCEAALALYKTTKERDKSQDASLQDWHGLRVRAVSIRLPQLSYQSVRLAASSRCQK